MLHRFKDLFVATVTTLAVTAGVANSGYSAETSQPSMFGKNYPFTVSDLPPSPVRARLQSLPEPARSRAMEWLHGFDFPANDLESMVIDDEGGVLYVDPGHPAPTAGDEPETEVEDSIPQPAASAADDAFLLHSRLGSAHVVYLDFDGHTITGTAWNTTIDPLYAKPYDLDGSPSTFSDEERSAIAEIWHRIAEDYAPFDIDVTTEEPVSFGPSTGRILITSKLDADGRAMPYNSGGGVAYVDVWGLLNYASYYSPAFVYYDNLSSGTTYIAEAGAHEFGHNLGLSHDGTSSLTYYAGHGSGYISWAPIMGTSYSKNVTQWSNGEYADANNTEDDIALIAEQLSLNEDDHGDDLNSATSLVIDSDGQILVSNPESDPHDLYPENKGVIDSAADQDLFYFSATAGEVGLSVNPAWDAFYRASNRGANLDILVSLLDASGTTLATSDPALDTYASISVSVPGGTYYLSVSGVGSSNYSDYSSTGQYFIAGHVSSGEIPNTPPVADLEFDCIDLGCSFTDSSIDSDGSIVAWAWTFGDGTTSTVQNPSHTYTSDGAYSVGLTVTDNDGASASATQGIVVASNDDNEPPVVTITSPVDDADVSDSVVLSAFATDNQEVAEINIYADGNLLCSGADSASCIWYLRKVASGTYTVSSDATDAAGNVGSASVSINVLDGGSRGNSGRATSY